ncbi:MAG: response regulator [Lachnospiraceae bacterium]|nr:response regulator [Lachnospiraceae bacterium]
MADTGIEAPKEYKGKKHSMVIPLLLVFVFVVAMVIYTSKLMYNVAVSNTRVVIEDRLLNVSSLIENHLNTAENVLHVTADSTYHMMLSGSTPARIHEFLVQETNNVSEQFDENYTGIYGYIMSRYMDGLNWEPPEDYDPKSRDWYVLAMQSDGEVVFVPPYVDAQTGNLIISVTRRLPDRQNVISLDVQLQGIQNMMKDLTLNGKGYGFVVDDTGLIIAHANESKKGTNIKDTEEGEDYLNAIRGTGAGSFRYILGKRPSSVYVNSIMNDWYVVMVVSNDEMYEEVRSQLLVNILIYTVICLMIGGIYYVSYTKEKAYAVRMEELKNEEQRKEYETQLLKLEKEAADNANKAKSNFLANMSHEIRTPMNAIIGMDEMILRDAKEVKIRKYAADIQSAGKTLLSIINDILDLSKIESGKMELISVDYDFASVLNDIVNMTMNKAKEKGLTYELTVEPDIPAGLRGDEIRIRQIILNLTNNAIKYTEQGGIGVHFSFDRAENRLRIRVSDTGMGIKEEDMDKLFSSFQRLDETKNRNIEGTGLGLNITRQLAAMMGGSVVVESKYGRGSTFTAEVVQEIVDATPIGSYTDRLCRAQDRKEEFKPALIAPKAKILIVDDNEMNLEVITELLRDTRIRISTALSGSESIEILKEERFDVILLDQMMPGMSGTQTLEAIRGLKLCDDTPVIALTADAIAGARDSYLSEGFTDYLSKPVMYEELEKVLIRYLDRSLLITKEELSKEKPAAKPLVLVIGEDERKREELGELFSDRYKGVFVKDEASAEKFLKRHEVAFILREGNRETELV